MDPVWAPRVLENLSPNDLQLYLDFSSSACIRGGACSVDTALQVLYQSKGDIKLAVQRLIHTNTTTAASENDRPPIQHDTPCLKTDTFWTKDELHLFERLFAAYGKNFSAISRDIRSKSTKECIEHYYLWKKSSARTITPSRRVAKHEQDYSNEYGTKVKQEHATFALVDSNNNSTVSLSGGPVVTTTTAIPRSGVIAAKLVISSNSKDQLPPGQQLEPCEQFPCKVCGRVFLKIKSRSAHMKRHKNER